MDSKQHSEIDANERAVIFQEEYGNDLDAGATLAEIVIAAGDFLSRIVGKTEVDAGMARIVEGVVEVAGGSIAEPSSWREALDDAKSYCFSDWALGAPLHDLAAYALYGIVLDDSEDADMLSAKIEDAVTQAEDFLRATPLTQWDINPGSDLPRLVRLASNRWALDNGKPVEPAALAEFGGVSEGRIRNMMSGAKRTFSSEGGRIPAQEALEWLAGRPEFWNSIWREQRLVRPALKERPPLERALFVPVARDGTAFGPGLERAGRFPIGEKGSEVQVEGFEQALAELQRMPVPYWRRPNAAGNWGIVAGVRWVRLDASELEALTETPDYKFADDGRA